MALNMKKGERLNLTKANGGQALTVATLGLGWNISPGAGRVDLDASAAIFDKDKKSVGVIYYGNRGRENDWIYHTGDNVTGEGDGDDEQIRVDLTRVPANVDHIVFTVNSFTRQGFNVVDKAYVCVRNGKSKDSPVVVQYELGDKGSAKAMIMGRLYRHEDGWRFQAIGDPAGDAQTVHGLVPAIQAIL